MVPTPSAALTPPLALVTILWQNMTSHFADQLPDTSDGSQPPLLFDGFDIDDEAPSGMLVGHAT